MKSLKEYRDLKGKSWKSKVSKEKEKFQDVTISIGLVEWSAKEHKLKPRRGKRLALRINEEESADSIREKAVDKWKNYNSDCYKEEDEYMLVFEDGKPAKFLPGTTELFNLKRYQEEVGRDYKRIILYLCSTKDFKLQNDDVDDVVFVSKKIKIEMDAIISDHDFDAFNAQLDADRALAIELQQQIDEENTEGTPGDTSEQHIAKQKEPSVDFSDQSSAIKSLKKNVDYDGQFFIVIRRGTSFLRCLNLWQRESRKTSSEKVLRVSFIGEQGIDTGAMSKEFLADAIPSMKALMFPNGAPVDSMYHIQNGNFKCCGEIAATSIVQGRPPPALFEECVYNMLVNPQAVDLNSLAKEKHFTQNENVMWEEIRKNVKDHQDIILENGYTGPIDDDHVEVIIGTVMASFINKRLSYVSEFWKGLSCYSLSNAMSQAPELFKSLFTIDNGERPVTANYVFSLLCPEYSEQGTTHRLLEDSVIDNFQDVLNSFEDESIIGCTESIAWNEGGTQECGDILLSDSDKFKQAKLTPAGVLGWLTGQRHAPIDGSSLAITVHFDHDCMTRNPKHTICFPQVGACGREITFPVAHMEKSDSFSELFLLAYCKGQSFGRP